MAFEGVQTGRVEVIPAILPKNFEDLQTHLEKVHGVAPVVQIDAVDGKFAKGKTWPYTDWHRFEEIVEEEHGLPFWGEFSFEFDLMIEHPEKEALLFTHAGASRIVLHAQNEHIAEAFQALIDMRGEAEFLTRVGVAVLPHTQPDLLEPFEAQFDFVQVMGIDHVGKQGEPFDTQSLFLVERLRRRYPNLPIQVDGGVTMENARKLAEAGATRLVVGSAIFAHGDPKAAYEQLLEEANK